MGMYTELNIGVAFKEDTPKEIIDAVKYLLCKTKEKPCIEHKLFSCTRHKMVLTCDSFAFDSISDSKMEYNHIDGQYHLNVRSNLKNYDSEIENFLDFISPYVETDGFIGYYRYEESENPTLIYIDNGTLKYKNPYDDF
jgi:hypothetical protein